MRSLLSDLLPPVLVRALVHLRGKHVRFQGGYENWDEAAAACSGYDAERILDKVLQAALKVRQSEAAFERDSVLFDQPEYVWPLATGLLEVAAARGGCLQVLDFGGSLGSTYFQHRPLLHRLSKIGWHVVEQGHYVRAGQEYLQDQCLRFHESIRLCLEEVHPDVILFSSVLQYLADPWAVLDELVQVGADLIVVDKTIVNGTAASVPYKQVVPASIYEASYPCWSLSESQLMDKVLGPYELLADFPSLEFPALARIDSAFKGYLFARANR